MPSPSERVSQYQNRFSYFDTMTGEAAHAAFTTQSTFPRNHGRLTAACAFMRIPLSDGHITNPSAICFCWLLALLLTAAFVSLIVTGRVLRRGSVLQGDIESP